jgi:hypothetical protein
LKKLILAFIKIYAGHIFGQTYTIIPQQVCVLPLQTKESSGIVLNAGDTNKIWTHNDSGDSAYMYQVTTQGQYIKKITIGTGKAIDIEDITRDDAGKFYIADIGNNSNNRTNLIIRKVANLDTVTMSAVSNDKIFISYPDQLQFPPPSNQQNFDCEALFHYNKRLYLFSKNRGNSGYSKQYSVPDSAGTYVATLHDSISTGTNLGAWITAADISPSKTKVALLSENTLHIFTNYIGNNFFGGTHLIYNFPSYTQKEAVAFINNNELYITDEYNTLLNNGGKLYKVNISNILAQNAWLTAANLSVYPNPSNDYVYITINHTLTNDLTINVYDVLGKVVLTKNISSSAINYITLPIANLPQGAYNIQLTHENVSSIVKFIKE